MKTVLSWSSGKDAAWALHVLNETPGIEVVGLVTTINDTYDRVVMHGVRRALVEAQSSAAGLKLHKVLLPNRCPNEIYKRRMSDLVTSLREQGVEAMAFGDIFLEDVRAYREANLEGSGITPLFPIWQGDKVHSRTLAERMIDAGLRARIVCLDPRRLSRDFSGREFDRSLLADLPPDVDPCGENGEYHTIAYAGPMFDSPVELRLGETVSRDEFVYCDILPADTP